jgi:TRAP-type mannitol/chloroaromatic compound transport system permease large subunit
MEETTRMTSMVFIILVGATAFGLVFRGMNGDMVLTDLILNAEISPNAYLALVMLIIFIAGFFIDFIEITFIIVPLVVPIFVHMGIDLLWLGILIALNLQTSFLTPPFGFSLFYLKGVSPGEVTTGHIYRGVIPFVVIQLICLVVVILFPETVTWLPGIIGR